MRIELMYNSNNGKYYTFVGRKEVCIYQDEKGYFFKNRGLNYFDEATTKRFEEFRKQFS